MYALDNSIKSNLSVGTAKPAWFRCGRSKSMSLARFNFNAITAAICAWLLAWSPPSMAQDPPAQDVQAEPTVTLGRVEARRHHWRDIRGTTDYCVDARFLRGWSQVREGLLVEVAPRRHAGHRYYQVETAESCPDLASAHSIRLVSRSGGAAVCGQPGDKVVLLDYSSQGLSQMGGAATHAFGRGCEIKRVTPVPRK